MATWDECEHEWVEVDAGQCEGKAGYIQVRCVKCHVPGEQDESDGSVFWPAT